YDFQDLGERSVKNIAQPIRVFHMILDRPKLEQTPGDSTASKLEVPASESAPEDEIPSLSETAGVSPDAQSVEIEFWDSIKNSVRAQEYEAYLEQYPEGSFVALARARLDAIAGDSPTMRDPQDREIEISFWESVRESANPALVQAY